MKAIVQTAYGSPDVIEGPYGLANLPEAPRFFGTGDHKGKIIITMALGRT